MMMSIGDGLDEDDIDSNALPTPFTFRDCELMYAWACVDWEAKAMGNLEDLLARFGSVRVQFTSPRL
jgi:hypothetical protein